MKPYGLIYLTTNTLNGMQYVGQTHYSEKMRDDYFGSGKAIKRAIAKYGKCAFERVTLFEAFTKNDLDWAERKIISDLNAASSRRFYNIAPGGHASLGFTGKKHSIERNLKLAQKMMGHAVSDKTRLTCQELGKKHGKALTEMKATCIHCGLTAQKGLISRWHNDKCKSLRVKL